MSVKVSKGMRKNLQSQMWYQIFASARFGSDLLIGFTEKLFHKDKIIARFLFSFLRYCWWFPRSSSWFSIFHQGQG